VFTQSHVDHIGGWQAFAEPDTQVYAQRMFSQIVGERRMLAPFFGPRSARVIAAMMLKRPPGASVEGDDPPALTTFADELAFSHAGRRFVLRSLFSGETLDSLAIWLPDEKTVFTGNWAGAIYGALPNFYTARGDRQRSVPGWLRQCRELLAQEPELLVTGHGPPIVGRDVIHASLMKVHDAVQYIHDETVRGMNAGARFSSIAAELCLPAALVPHDGRCPPHWIARAVYEEYAGWFRQERTSELYPTPGDAIWPELVECAGGAGTIADRAAGHLAAGDLERALLFIEMAVHSAPEDPAIRRVERAILDQLAERDGRRTFDLLGWIEGRLGAAENAINASDQSRGPTE
jgi:alkyl sulfatase BDS1-like metallo-beta-lactamase superfamily hydrolase